MNEKTRELLLPSLLGTAAVVALSVIARPRKRNVTVAHERMTSLIVNRTLDECYAFSAGRGADIIAALGTVSFEAALNGKATLIRAAIGGHAAHRALRHFKQILETGEIPTTHGQPTGKRSFFGESFTKGLEP